MHDQACPCGECSDRLDQPQPSAAAVAPRLSEQDEAAIRDLLNPEPHMTVGRPVNRQMYRDLLAELDLTRAGLAASQALAESRGLVIAQMREACIEEVGPDHDEVQCSICLACWPIPGPPQHEEDCFLAQPEADAAALAGAVLAAGEELVKWCEYNAQHWPTCAVNRDDDEGCNCGRNDVIVAYRRARAALRGDGEAGA